MASHSQNVPLFGRKEEILRLRGENAKLVEDNRRLYADNSDMLQRINQLGGMEVKQRDDMIRELDERISSLRGQVSSLDGDISAKRAEIRELGKKALDLREYADLQDDGLYDYENPAENSVELSAKTRREQGQAKIHGQEQNRGAHDHRLHVQQLASKGRKFLNDMSRMALSLYNAEAENCVKSVKAGNLETSITLR